MKHPDDFQAEMEEALSIAKDMIGAGGPVPVPILDDLLGEAAVTLVAFGNLKIVDNKYEVNHDEH